jgi:hypothetical protein
MGVLMMNRMTIARSLLILWLAFSVKKNDDLYGTLMSIRRLLECRKVVHSEEIQPRERVEWLRNLFP